MHPSERAEGGAQTPVAPVAVCLRRSARLLSAGAAAKRSPRSYSIVIIFARSATIFCPPHAAAPFLRGERAPLWSNCRIPHLGQLARAASPQFRRFLALSTATATAAAQAAPPSAQQSSDSPKPCERRGLGACGWSCSGHPTSHVRAISFSISFFVYLFQDA